MVRRWVLRPLCWALAVLAIAVLLLHLLLQSEWLARRIASFAEEKLEEALGRDVELGALRLGLLPLEAEVEDLAIAGAVAGDPPLFAVDRVVIDADLWSLRKSGLVLERVAALRPIVHLTVDEEGNLQLPELAGRDASDEEETAGFELVLERLQVGAGEVWIEDLGLPASFSAVQVEVLARRVAAREDRVSLRAGEVEVELPAEEEAGTSTPARTLSGALTARMALRPGEIELWDASLAADHLVASASGRVALGEEVAVSLSVQLDADGALASDLGVLASDLDGSASLVAEVEMAGGTWRVTGDLTVPGLGADEVRVHDAFATFQAEPDVLTVELERASIFGGGLAGSFALPLGSTDLLAAVEVDLDALRLGALAAALDIGIEVRGEVSGTARYEFSPQAALRGSGSAELDLVGRIDETQEVLGLARAAITDGVVSLAPLELYGAGERLEASGEIRLSDLTGAFEYSLTVQDIGRLSFLMPEPEGEGTIDWAGADGSVTAAGALELRGTEMRLTGDVETRALTIAGARADQGFASLILDRGVLDVVSLTLHRGQARLDAHGLVPLAAGEPWDFAITADDWPLEELEGFFARDLGLSGGLSGALALQGAIGAAGEAADFIFSGDVDLRSPAFMGIDVDEATGSFRMSSLLAEISGFEARIGEGRLGAEVRIPFRPDGEWDVRAEARGWPLGELGPLLPEGVALTGALSGMAGFAGAAEALNGSADLTAEGVLLGDLALGQISIRGAFGPERVRIASARVDSPAGSLWLEGTLHRLTGELDFDLGSEPLRLDAQPFAGLVDAESPGELRIGGRLEGTLEAPLLDASLIHEAEGTTEQSRFHLMWNGREVEAEGSLLGLVAVEGGGLLDFEQVDLELHVGASEISLPLPEAEGAPDLLLSVAGQLALAKVFASADPLVARVVFDSLMISSGTLELRNLEPVVARLEEDVVVVESFFLGEPSSESEIFAVGSIGTEAPYPLDLRMQAFVQSEWGNLVFPDFSASGSVELLATVEGVATRPEIDGQGAVSNGRLRLTEFAHIFANVRGVVLFYPDKVVVDHLDSEVAGGTARAAGSIGFGAETPYELQLSAKNVTLGIPEGWRTRGSAELILTSQDGGRTLRGQINLERADFFQDVNISGLSPDQILVGETDELLRTTYLDLVVRGEQALRVRNNLADVRGGLDLVILGTLAAPIIFGDASLVPGGTIEFSGNEYRLERGRLEFVNPYENEPILDLVATGEVGRYDITLVLAGELENPTINLSSDPPLSDLEVVALLAGANPDSVGGFGTFSASDASSQRSPEQAAQSLILGQAASAVSSRFNRLFGLDTFQIAPLTAESGDLSSARVTVGERLSRDLFVTYSYDPSTTQQMILQVEWQVYPSMAIILTQNGDESYSADFRWEKRF